MAERQVTEQEWQMLQKILQGRERGREKMKRLSDFGELVVDPEYTQLSGADLSNPASMRAKTFFGMQATGITDDDTFYRLKRQSSKLKKFARQMVDLEHGANQIDWKKTVVSLLGSSKTGTYWIVLRFRGKERSAPAPKSPCINDVMQQCVMRNPYTGKDMVGYKVWGTKDRTCSFNKNPKKCTTKSTARRLALAQAGVLG